MIEAPTSQLILPTQVLAKDPPGKYHDVDLKMDLRPLKSISFMEKIQNSKRLRDCDSVTLTTVTDTSSSDGSLSLADSVCDDASPPSAIFCAVPNPDSRAKRAKTSPVEKRPATVDTFGWDQKAAAVEEASRGEEGDEEEGKVGISDDYLALIKARVKTRNASNSAARRSKRAITKGKSRRDRKTVSKRTFGLGLLVAYSDAVPEAFDRILDDVVDYSVDRGISYRSPSQPTKTKQADTLPPKLNSAQVIASYMEESKAQKIPASQPPPKPKQMDKGGRKQQKSAETKPRAKRLRYFSLTRMVRVAVTKWCKTFQKEGSRQLAKKRKMLTSARREEKGFLRGEKRKRTV